MTQFKHKDRVTCEINNIKIEDARISINKNGTPFICYNNPSYDGADAEDKLGYKYSWVLKEDFTDDIVTNLRLAEEQGDTANMTIEVPMNNIPKYPSITIEEAKKLLEDAGYVVEKWAPKNGCQFWYFNSKGEKIKQRWEDTAKQNNRLAFGNCFPTEHALDEALLKVKEVIK